MIIKKIIPFKLILLSGLILLAWLLPFVCRAMPPGTLLYRTTRDGKMYGYSGDTLIDIENGLVKDIYPGHVGIYIGQENGVDYVVEALPNGVVKTPAAQFINLADGEKFLGAKLPRDLSPLQQARAVALAKSLASRGLAYDFDFKRQKGPDSGQWTCVGLVEKIYESADIPNPNNLAALEYDPAYYAINITPDGFDNTSLFNAEGDCLSANREFSKIARREDTILPAPELIGFNAGLEHQGDRYIFLPYTQFIQNSLTDVSPDIALSSHFSSDKERGEVRALNLILRWSLINNPISSVKQIAREVKSDIGQILGKAKDLALSVKEKILGGSEETAIVLGGDGPVRKTSGASGDFSENGSKSSNQSKSSEKADVNFPAVKMSINANPLAPGPLYSAAEAAPKSSTPDKSQSTALASSTSEDLVSIALSQESDSLLDADDLAVPSETPAQAIMINRIYSTGTNDWVELFNPNDFEVDLSAAEYRLERAKTAKDPSLILRIGNPADGAFPGGTIIAARGYYLIVSARANDYYLSRADAIVTREGFSWGSSGYTIYLGIDSISSYDDADIVDAVGFGPDALYFQGTAPAPLITDNYILRRLYNQRDNAVDFGLAPSDDPALISFFQAPPSPPAASSGSNPSSSSTSSSVVATSTTPMATSTTPVATSTDPMATSTDPVATSTEAVATSTEAVATSTELTSANALISEIYSTGTNDWLKIFNPNEFDLDLQTLGFRLERSKTAADPSLIMRFGNEEDGIYPGGTIIPAGGEYLVARDEASNYYLNQADAISYRDDFSWGPSGYSLYLGRNPISSSTDQDIVDLVGFGPEALNFLGSAPAPAIPDYYVLKRLLDENNQAIGFNLEISDDPERLEDGEDDDFVSLPDIYAAPLPIISEGLVDLWNFDECYGQANLVVGKWECAKKLGSSYPSLPLALSETLSLESFSLSFYYRADFESPQAFVKIFSTEDEMFKLGLEPNTIISEGLPAEERSFNIPGLAFNNISWHQFTLTVNQAEDYWAVYIDGAEKLRVNFFARLPLIDRIEVGGDQGSIIIDELAVWNRALSVSEAADNFQADSPFYPNWTREAQKPAVLKYFWRFQEDDGDIARDELASTTLHVSPNAWLGRSHDNYALITPYDSNFWSDLTSPLIAQDLSLSFWWKNISYPKAGRTGISLFNSQLDDRLFSLSVDYSAASFWLNNNYGLFNDPFILPNDELWHNLALVYDSYRSKLSFYVDGEEKANQLFIRFPDNLTIDKLRISSDSDRAAIDDLSIWEGALSAAEISNIFTNNK